MVHRHWMILAMTNDLKEYFASTKNRVEKALVDRLPQKNILPKMLYEAMHYSVLGGGKRIRPMLTYCSGKALGLSAYVLDGPACAVELIHSYSLIHDDLPAMDNDYLRRGKPSCHIAYDEATAILAGDALQALAFEILANDHTLKIDSVSRLKMLTTLSKASGCQGMVKGQAIDLASVGLKLNLPELENMHIHKTGALIRASVNLAALAKPELNTELAINLDNYAKCIGLIFQVRDDILDEEGDTATLGKTSGKDKYYDKPTYTSVLGLDGAKQKVQQLYAQALQSLNCFGAEADLLRDLSLYVVQRHN